MASSKSFPPSCAKDHVQRLPELVYEPSSDSDRAAKLVAGNRHAAMMTLKGEVLTFGIGSAGQLGRVDWYNEYSIPPLRTLFTPTKVIIPQVFIKSRCRDVKFKMPVVTWRYPVESSNAWT